MSKLLKTFGLFTILGIVPLWVYGSEESPWGVVAVWECGEKDGEEWWKFPSTEQVSPPDQWRKEYCPQLDSMKSCGLTWNRPNCMARCEPSEGYFRFDAQDSLVTFMQERDLNLCAVGWPRPHYTIPDSVGWARYWRMQVEHLDGDGEGYGGYDEMPGLTKPVKYWEICNEPEGGQPWGQTWGSPITSFRSYVRITHDAIDSADPTAKVVAPAIVKYIWENSGTDNDTASSPVYWLARVLEDGGANYIDVISHHYPFYHGTYHPWYGFSSAEEYLDCLDDTIEYYASGKPLWLTEEGCHTDDELEKANFYMDLCRTILKRDWSAKGNKVFFFALQWTGEGGQWAILNPDFSHRPAFDSLQNFIYFTSDKDDITFSNNQRKFVVDPNGNLHLVTSTYGDIRYAKSFGADYSWTSYWALGDGKYPVLAIDNADGINVSWIEEEDKVSRLYFRKNNGTWGVPVVLLKEQSDYGVRFSSPAMVVDSNNIVHIVLTEVFWATIQEEEKDSPGANTQWVLAPPGANTRWSLTYICYTPSSGAKETKKLDIATIDGFKGLGNSIASIDIDMNSAPHITWTRPSWSETGEVYYITRTDTGWTETVNVSESPDISSSHPFIDFYDNHIYVVWEEEGEIYLIKKPLEGDFGESVNISNTPSYISTSPQVLDGVIIVWEEEGEVYRSRKAMLGWGKAINISNTTIDSKYPQAVLNDPESILSVTWTEGDNSPYKVDFNQTDVLPPLAPTGLTGVWSYIGSNRAKITLTWNANTEPDLDGYYVYRKTSGGGWQKVKTVSPSASPTCLDIVYAWSTYYYCVTAFDILQNESDPSGTIRVDPEYYPCPFLYTWNGSEFIEDNNILAGSGQGEVVEDWYKLREKPVKDGNRYRLQLREEGSEHSFLDRIRLIAIDHPDSVEIFVTPDAQIVPVSSMNASQSVMGENGTDYTTSLLERDSVYVEANEVEKITAKFGETIGGDYVILAPPDPKVELVVEKATASGFESVGSIRGRENPSYEVLPLTVSSNEDVSLVFTFTDVSQRLDYIRFGKRNNAPYHIKPCPLVSATHSDIGSVKQKLLIDDENYAELLPCDTITLEFAVVDIEPGWVRDFVFVSNGYYVTEGEGGSQTAYNNIPMVHSLSLYPNPARNDMNIRFGIPREERVSLKIYDVSGREVKTLVDGRLEAGYHTIRLDGKNLPSGIYFARLVTDGFEATKKLVLMK